MLFLLLACANGDDTGSWEPTFTNVESQVLGPSCGFSSCHGSNTGDLTLDGEGDFDRLVNVDATTGAVLVIPGDADGSYLIQKLEGTDGIEGDIMPPGGGLSADRVQLVRDWIDAGAPND